MIEGFGGIGNGQVCRSEMSGDEENEGAGVLEVGVEVAT